VKAQLDTELASLDESDKRIKAIGDWADGGVNALDELYDLTERIPDTNNVQLRLMTIDPLTRTAKSKQVAKMTLKGVTTNDHKGVDELTNDFSRDPHLRPDPKRLSPNLGPDRFRFAQQFEARVDIAKQAPTDYRLRLPEPAANDRGRDRRRQGNEAVDFGFGVGP
jgi:hypothetical protein